MKLTEFLQRSAMTAGFRDAVHAFLATGQPNEQLDFPSHAPPVKVERTLTKVLEEYPEAEIECLRITAESGCEFFRGEISLRTPADERRIRFYWDCRWKAIQQGWTDYFGFPDQGRAAREFGHDCFRSWEDLTLEVLAEA